MESYVNERATVVAVGEADAAGCAVVRVDVDGGRWAWRERSVIHVTNRRLVAG
jgi:hypothetical protein